MRTHLSTHVEELSVDKNINKQGKKSVRYTEILQKSIDAINKMKLCILQSHTWNANWNTLKSSGDGILIRSELKNGNFVFEKTTIKDYLEIIL